MVKLLAGETEIIFHQVITVESMRTLSAVELATNSSRIVVAPIIEGVIA
ncbi:MAG: hypothetical protein ACJAQS_000245 [Porticoccus sp.]|jgi:hypothetical protein